MVKSTQFYEQNTKNAMKLRSGKAINCMLSTTICSQIENICYHNDNHYYSNTYKYRAFKKRDCLHSSSCRLLNKFIYTLKTHYKTINSTVTMVILNPSILNLYLVGIKVSSKLIGIKKNEASNKKKEEI